MANASQLNPWLAMASDQPTPEEVGMLMMAQNPPQNNPNFDPSTLDAAASAPPSPPVQKSLQAQAPQGFQMPQMSPEQKALQTRINAMTQADLMQQKSGLQQLQMLANHEGSKKPQLDLSPLAALTDTWSGSHLAKNYQAPETPQEQQHRQFQMMNQIQERQGNLTKEELGYLQSKVNSPYTALLAAMSGQRLALQNERLGQNADKIAAGAAGAFDKDPIMMGTTRQLNQIGVDRHTLANSPVITPQILHEISNGIAAALAGGKASGLGMSQMQDLSTSQSKFAALEQNLLNKPENAASPEIRQQALDTLDRLEESYTKLKSDRAQQLTVGRKYSHVPAARQAVEEKAASYQNSAPSLSSEDQAAITWAKSNPTDPRASKILQLHGGQ